MLSDNVIFEFDQKVIAVRDPAGRCIFNRQNAVIGPALLHRGHNLPERGGRKTSDAAAEAFLHRLLGIGAGRPEIYHPRVRLVRERVPLGKIIVPGAVIQLVLVSAADAHQLLENLLYRVPVEFTGAQTAHCFELLLLPLLIIDRLPDASLVFRNIRRNPHPTLKQLDNLPVNPVDFLSGIL